MGSENNNIADQDEAGEGVEQALDFWSDEGARRFNEAIEEGSTYAWANPHRVQDFEEPLDDKDRYYVDPDLHDPDEGTLTPGEMEIILENCYIN